jgi:predicted Zn-dependent protease
MSIYRLIGRTRPGASFSVRPTQSTISWTSRIRSRQRSYATYNRFQSSGSTFNWSKNGKWVGLAGGGLGIFYITHLEEAPYSHRRRFMWVSPGLELLLGEQAYRQTLSEFRGGILPDEHPDAVRVQRVMKRIIKQSGLEDLDWKIHVVHAPESSPNAFVLPGGKVFVLRNILPICGNDDGLATVLAHETAHQVNRHIAEKMSYSPIYMALGIVLYTITGSSAVNRIVLNALFQLPASREMEAEADYVGLMMMSKACFNPSEAVHMWERMSAYEKKMSRTGGQVPEFLSTHPANQSRINNIQGWMSEANSLRDQAGCDQGGVFNQFVNIPRDFW